jgi:uncharacterized protein (UPF0332 family)
LLNSFHIEFPGDNDLRVRVRINEEDVFWSHSRAAHDLEPGATIQPIDVIVEPLPLPERPAERFIRGVWTGDSWELEIQLNRPHPRRTDHLGAAREFVEAADLLLAKGHLRAFYESAFHAVEHLAQAELLSYAPAAEIVSTAKTHQTVRSTYMLWARLGNTDERFSRLLTALEQVRQATTYLRGEAESDPNHSEQQLAVLHEMLDCVAGVVEEGRGRGVVHLLASRDIRAGELVGTADLRLHSGNQRRRR